MQVITRGHADDRQAAGLAVCPLGARDFGRGLSNCGSAPALVETVVGLAGDPFPHGDRVWLLLAALFSRALDRLATLAEMSLG